MAKKRTIRSEKITEEDLNPQVSNDVQSELEKKEDIGYFTVTGYPTAGKLYPEGTVIKARPLKVIEVKMLSQMDEETADDVVNDILRRALIGIDVDNIYAVDKLYFVFWLRANTYKDSGFEVEFKCPLCKKMSTYNYSIDTLKVRTFDDESLSAFENEFKLPKSDLKMKLKLLTVADEQENKKFIRDNEKSLMNFDAQVLTVCKMIDTINGEKKGMIEKYMYVTEEITAGDYAYIESLIQDRTAGCEPTINVKCNECGGSTESVLPFQPSFFLPKVST
jgi:hypothetical protein